MSEAAASLAALRARDFRRMVALSAAAHAALSLATLLSWPSFREDELPAGPPIALITADELAARLATVTPPARPKPAPPEAAPQPEPVVEPPPTPEPEKVVIPEDTHRKPAEAKPKPAPAEREPEPRPRPPQEVEQVDLEDVLFDARIEAGAMPGEARPAPAPARPVPGAGGTAPPDSPEVAAWKQRVRAHIKRNWGVQPGFRGKRLTTLVEVTLTSSGAILDYDVERSSGNPWFDDGVERYLAGEDELPAPPRGGAWSILFDGDL